MAYSGVHHHRNIKRVGHGGSSDRKEDLSDRAAGCSTSARTHHSSKGDFGELGHVAPLPPLLSCKSFVQECKHLGDVELDILQIEVLKVVLLHLQEIVQLEIKLQ